MLEIVRAFQPQNPLHAQIKLLSRLKRKLKLRHKWMVGLLQDLALGQRLDLAQAMPTLPQEGGEVDPVCIVCKGCEVAFDDILLLQHLHRVNATVYLALHAKYFAV